MARCCHSADNGRQFVLARKADLPPVAAEADGCGAEYRLDCVLGQHVSAAVAQEMGLGILIGSMVAAGRCVRHCRLLPGCTAALA